MATSQFDMTKVVIAEAVGTFMLVLFGSGSVVAAVLNGMPGGVVLLIAAFAHGVALMIIVNMLGRISGAHVNPAVTIGLASVNRFPWSKVPAYIIAQFVGAFIASLAIVAVYGDKAAKIANAGAPSLSAGINGIQGTLAEAFGAFILIAGVVTVAADTRNKYLEGWAGFIIGFALFTGILLAGPASGAGLNPALAVSPFLTAKLFGGSPAGGELLVYLIGPVIGGVVATLLYSYLADLPGSPFATSLAGKKQ
jgi:glycerol uptake facilitator protein